MPQTVKTNENGQKHHPYEKHIDNEVPIGFARGLKFVLHYLARLEEDDEQYKVLLMRTCLSPQTIVSLFEKEETYQDLIITISNDAHRELPAFGFQNGDMRLDIVPWKERNEVGEPTFGELEEYKEVITQARVIGPQGVALVSVAGLINSTGTLVEVNGNCINAPSQFGWKIPDIDFQE